jgi:hypothetical protein
MIAAVRLLKTPIEPPIAAIENSNTDRRDCLSIKSSGNFLTPSKNVQHEFHSIFTGSRARS